MSLFNALRWFVRAGCPWRMLPNDLPPWTAVEQQAKRWMRAGCFEAMAHDLRAVMRLLHERAARTHGGGHGWAHAPKQPGERRASGLRRLQAQKGQQGPRGRGHAGQPAGAWPSHPPTSRNVPRSANWPRRCKRPPARTSNWPTCDQGYTGQEAAEAQRRPTASNWRWSNSLRPSAASCCCPAAGSSSDPSLGWPVSAGFRVITNALLPLSPDCIGWLLPAFYSATCSESALKVNDRL